MKNRKLLFTLSLASILTLVGCKKDEDKPSSNTGSNPSGQVSPSTDDTPSTDDNTTGDVSDDTSDQQNIWPKTSAEAKELFATALSRDYSNMTAEIYDQNEVEESWEAVEYYVDGYQIVDQNADSSGYLYYHDYNSSNYLWLAPEDADKEGAWCNKGAMMQNGKQSDLSIWNTYFYMPLLLKGVTADDVTYLAGGLYDLNVQNKVDEFNESVFGFGWFHNVTSVRFSITSDGYFYQVAGFDDINDESDDAPFVQVTVKNVGETVAPVSDLPEAPNEKNTKEYWQYKGYTGPEQQVKVKDITISHAADSVIEGSGENEKVVLDIEGKTSLSYTFNFEDLSDSKNHPVESKDIRWHSSDESIVKFGDTPKDASGKFISQSREIVGVKEGEATIWAEDEYSKVKSNEIKVKVNPLGALNKEGCVFDLTFTGMDNEGNVTANNAIGNNLPYSIKSNNINAAYIQDGSNSEIWKDSDQVMLMDCCTQESGSEAIVEYDFKDQQVTSLSMYYGYYYSAGKDALQWLSEAVIETSADGTSWTTAKDIKDEIIRNWSYTNLKILNATFTKSSHVRIRLKSSMVVSGFKFAYSNIVFNADDTCSHGIPAGQVRVDSVTLSAPKSSVRVSQSLPLTAAVVTNTGSYNGQLTWTSSDESVARIETVNGVTTLKGVGVGTTKVKVSAKNYDNTDVESNQLTITVTEALSLEANLQNTFWKGELSNPQPGVYTQDKWTISVSTTSLTMSLDSNSTVSYTLQLEDYDDTNNNYVFRDGDSYLNVSKVKTPATTSIIEVKGVLKNFKLSDNSLVDYEVKDGINVAVFDKYVAATSLSITSSDGSNDMIVGQTKVLTATLNPSDATAIGNEISWSSSDENIATIENRTVTAIAAGDVTITATTESGVSATYNIHVAAKIEPASIQITAADSATEIEKGTTLQLTAHLKASDGTETVNVPYSLTWTSSDGTKVSVDRNGLVTGVDVTTEPVVITCKIDGKEIQSTYNISVKASSAEGGLNAIAGAWSYTNADNDDITLTINVTDNTAILNYAYFIGSYGDDEGNNEFKFDAGKSTTTSFVFTNDDLGDLTVTISGSDISVTLSDDSILVLSNAIFTKQA